MNNTLRLVSLLVQAEIPVVLWGTPGTGKTAAIVQLGENMTRWWNRDQTEKIKPGVTVEAPPVSAYQKSDILGLPYKTDNGVDFAAPSWAQRIHAAGGGIVFFDEYNQAAPSVQGDTLRVIQERQVANLILSHTAFVAACNETEDSAGGWDFTPPAANRFVHLKWKQTVTDWAQGMVTGWPEPTPPDVSDWPSRLGKNVSLVTSFLNHQPNLANRMPEGESRRGKAWPSYRTWEMAAKIMALTEDEDARMEMINGAVGEASLTFFTWMRELDIPDPEELLKNPSGLKLPVRGDQVYALLSGVISAVHQTLTPPRWEASWEILHRTADAGQRAIAAGALKLLVTPQIGEKIKTKELEIPKASMKHFRSLHDMIYGKGDK